jgi:hypothetical protein
VTVEVEDVRTVVDRDDMIATEVADHPDRLGRPARRDEIAECLRTVRRIVERTTQIRRGNVDHQALESPPVAIGPTAVLVGTSRTICKIQQSVPDPRFHAKPVPGSVAEIGWRIYQNSVETPLFACESRRSHPAGSVIVAPVTDDAR